VRLSEDFGEAGSEAWKISEEFAIVLEEFESVVSVSPEISRITVFILKGARSVKACGLGPFFLKMSLKF